MIFGKLYLNIRVKLMINLTWNREKEKSSNNKHISNIYNFYYLFIDKNWICRSNIIGK